MKEFLGLSIGTKKGLEACLKQARDGAVEAAKSQIEADAVEAEKERLQKEADDFLQTEKTRLQDEADEKVKQYEEITSTKIKNLEDTAIKFEDTNADLQIMKAKQDSLQGEHKILLDINVDLRDRLESVEQLTTTDFLIKTEPYLMHELSPNAYTRGSSTVLFVGKKMEGGQMSVSYMRNFFDTLYNLDEMLKDQEELPYGLILLKKIRDSYPEVDIETLRVITSYVANRVARQDVSKRLVLYRFWCQKVENNEIAEARVWYKKNEKHDDFVRNLRYTDKEFIKAKTQCFDTWDEFLNAAQHGSEETTEVMAMNSYGRAKVIVGRLKAYERKHNITLTIEKDF